MIPAEKRLFQSLKLSIADLKWIFTIKKLGLCIHLFQMSYLKSVSPSVQMTIIVSKKISNRKKHTFKSAARSYNSKTGNSN